MYLYHRTARKVKIRQIGGHSDKKTRSGDFSVTGFENRLMTTVSQPGVHSEWAPRLFQEKNKLGQRLERQTRCKS